MKGYLEHEMLTLFFLHFPLIGWICCLRILKAKEKNVLKKAPTTSAGSVKKQNNKQRAVN